MILATLNFIISAENQILNIFDLMIELGHSVSKRADILLCSWFPKFTSVYSSYLLWLSSPLPSPPAPFSAINTEK